MAHVLCIINGLTGIVNATCALGRRLEAAGHRVTVASPADIGPRIEPRGFGFVPLDGPAAGWSPAQRRADPAKALGLHSVPDMLRTVAPDGVLVDVELHGHTLAALNLGLPTGLLCPFLNVFKSPGLPPLHRSGGPRSGGLGRLAVEWQWWRYRVWTLGRLTKRRLRSRASDNPSLFRALARDLAIDFGQAVDFSAWLYPFVVRDVPLLYLSPRELDLPHDPPAHVAHAGPMVDADRPEPALDAADRSRLDALLDGRRGRPGGTDAERPLILVSMSTVATGDAAFLRRVVDMAAAEPDWDVVMALGGKADPSELGETPANVHAFGYLPQMEVLPLADAMVMTAGQNSMIECVLNRVPMLTFSLDRNDQNGNVARVVHHGIGIAGDLSRATAEDLRRDVRRLLEEPGFRQRVNAMGDYFLAYDQREAAVTAVERMLDLERPVA